MTAEDVIMASAEAGAATVQTQMFVSMTEKALSLIGVEIEKLVHDEDRPGLFSPVEIARQGKNRIGGILVLDDRLILGWVEGNFRIKNFEAVVPKDTITSVTRGVQDGSAFSKPRETLTIAAQDTWQLTFANLFEGGTSIVPFLEGVIDGSIRPTFE